MKREYRFTYLTCGEVGVTLTGHGLILNVSAGMSEINQTKAEDLARQIADALNAGRSHGNDPASIFATADTDQAEARNAKTVCLR